jgi:hypothetical protein
MGSNALRLVRFLVALFAMIAFSGCGSAQQNAVALHMTRSVARTICQAVGAVDGAFPETSPSGEVVVTVPVSSGGSSAPPEASSHP